jgi:hypothetical protein
VLTQKEIPAIKAYIASLEKLTTEERNARLREDTPMNAKFDEYLARRIEKIHEGHAAFQERQAGNDSKS